ncbi:MauE/DoxX family redox-associated membrane protein [Novipirellula artificiosorum]|uniref:Methylamine utilisation protein MauE domain-containing protein n=1 Tax=Novipirellula artificiosorum TaxID=2528016 RepID=A0A5C6DVR9_9BACT|nr:hypothetical protein Poly41_16550 [Novipirellula artificiosorum]
MNNSRILSQVLDVASLLQILAVLLAVPLLVSAFIHLTQPYLFLDHLLRYEILAGHWAGLVVICLPPFQILLAMSLLGESPHRISLLLTGALYMAFASAQGYALWANTAVHCGCFGSGGSPISLSSVVSVLFAAVVSFLLGTLFFYRISPVSATVHETRSVA